MDFINEIKSGSFNLNEFFCIVGVGDCIDPNMEIKLDGNVLYIYTKSIDVSNGLLVDMIVSTIISDAQTCSGYFSGDKTKTNNTLEFRCVDANVTRSAIVVNMVKNLVSALQDNKNQDIMIRMGLLANSQSNSGFLDIVNTSINNDQSKILKNNYNLLKNYQKNIVNVFSNSIQKTFPSSIVTNCVMSVDTELLKTSSLNPVTDSYLLMKKCIEQNGVVKLIINDFLNTFGIIIKDSPTSNLISTSNRTITSATDNVSKSTNTNTTSDNNSQTIYIIIIVVLCILLLLFCVWGTRKYYLTTTNKNTE
jgi:hypothetical protein